MRRITMDHEEDRLRQGAGDHFMVATQTATFVVSTVMARAIEATIDRWPRRTWVTFVDLSGSRIRLRVREIDFIVQSTAEQRAFDRRLRQTINGEQ
jgi:hypothetical protein